MSVRLKHTFVLSTASTSIKSGIANTKTKDA